MKCLDAGQIARMVALDLDDTHLGECLECRRRYELDRSLRASLAVIAVPTLGAAHRTRLAAELMAAADARPVRPRRRAPVLAAALALAAAGVLATVWPRALSTVRPAIVAPVAVEQVGIVAAHGSADATKVVAPRRVPASAVSLPRAESVAAMPIVRALGAATFEHVGDRELDRVTLSDGTLALDTRDAHAAIVRVGATSVQVTNASVRVQARAGRIVSVQVVVGAAHVDHAGERVTIVRDAVWTPGPSASQRSLAAFRAAWTALRTGENLEAMRRFDDVTDPVAREEAAYWAAVAAQRAGDESAPRRMAEFRRAYPASKLAE